MKELYYSSAEICKMVGISKNTLIRWEEAKLIPIPHRDGRGWRLWTKSDLNKILETKKAVDRKKQYVSTENKIQINIIGYGNQGAVWAKNLRDAGADVTVLLRNESDSSRLASNDGMELQRVDDGIVKKGIFCLLIPDEKHKEFFDIYKDKINPDSIFIFAHGFSIGYQQIKLNAKKVLLAPKAIANIMRSNYLDNKPTPAAISMEFADGVSNELIEKIAEMLGLAPLIETTFLEESISDLFSEQVILCGGVPAILVKSFNLMVKNGINPKLALQECLYELTYILEVVKEKGLASLFKSISPVARRGGEKAWENINSGKSIDEILEKHFKDVESKVFLEELNNHSSVREKILDEVKMFDRSIYDVSSRY